MVSLLHFFQWANGLWIGDWIRNSIWIFPAIEGVHIVALTMLFGTIIFIDLQMLGLVRRDTPVAHLEEDLRPWTFCSLVVILVTGLMLFSSEATKLFLSGPFRIKMVALFAAILFHYTIHRRVPAKATAAISLMLWLTVGFAGRAIGFF